MPIHDQQQEKFSVNYAWLIPRAAIMGPIRGAYQGASVYKLFLVTLSIVFGIYVPFAPWIILSALVTYSAIEAVKYFRNEINEQKKLWKRQQALDARKKEYVAVQLVPAPDPQPEEKKLSENVLSLGEKIYDHTETFIRSFKDSGKLVLSCLFLSGLSYKMGLFLTHPTLFFVAIGIAITFAVMGFIEYHMQGKRKDEIKNLKAEKKAYTAKVCNAFNAQEELAIIDENSSVAEVKVAYKKHYGTEKEYQKPAFTFADMSKPRLLLHGFSGLVNGAYLCVTMFFLSTVLLPTLGFHPFLMLSSAMVSGGLFTAKFIAEEWRRQKQEFEAKAKLDFYEKERDAVYHNLFFLNPDLAEKYTNIREVTPKTTSSLEKADGLLSGLFSRTRHVGRAFKNSSKFTLALFLVAGTSVVVIGPAAIIPVSIFVVAFCSLSIVEFNTKSNALKRIEHAKQEKKVVKKQIHALRQALLMAEQQKNKVAVPGAADCKHELPATASTTNPQPINLVNSPQQIIQALGGGDAVPVTPRGDLPNLLDLGNAITPRLHLRRRANSCTGEITQQRNNHTLLHQAIPAY